MISQSTSEYDPTNYVKGRGGQMGPLPVGYTCHRCGQGGHYIKHCPTNNVSTLIFNIVNYSNKQNDEQMDVKRSTGIPRSFMVPATAETKGALLTANGEFAVPKIDK